MFSSITQFSDAKRARFTPPNKLIGFITLISITSEVRDLIPLQSGVVTNNMLLFSISPNIHSQKQYRTIFKELYQQSIRHNKKPSDITAHQAVRLSEFMRLVIDT